MVAGKHRSRTMRRVFRRTPGAKLNLHFRMRRPSKAVCGDCGRVLPGVPCERPRKLQSIPRTSRRPERPYGGVLCSACSRKRIIAKARK